MEVNSLIEAANASGISYRHVYGDVALNDYQSRTVADPDCPLCNGSGIVEEEVCAPYSESFLVVPVINQCECVEGALREIHRHMEGDYYE